MDDIRNLPDRYLRIAAEEGVETYLDLETGHFAYLLGGSIEGGSASFPDLEDDSPMFEQDDFTEESPAGGPFLRPLMDATRAMLDGYGYNYQQTDETYIMLTVRGPKGINSLFITADDAKDYVRVVGSYGPAVPVERRAAVAEAVCRASVVLGYGNFELDFADGELRFRISIDMEGGLFAEKMADNLVGCTLHTMDRYAEAFYKVAFGTTDPCEALEEVE